MDSKRRVSKVDDRLIKENEYIGRVLNEKVKEIDKLKFKFEKKLQQEKEKFAVQHLNVTSSFNEKKGARKKKISLAFDQTERQMVGCGRNGKFGPKSISDSDLARREILYDGDRLDCLFPPLVNNPKEIDRKYSRSFSEGIRVQKEGSSTGSSRENVQSQRSSEDSSRSGDSENTKRGRRISRLNTETVFENELSKPLPHEGSSAFDNRETSFPLNTTITEECLPDWQREIMEGKRRGREGRKSDSDIPTESNNNIMSYTEQKSKPTRSRRHSSNAQYTCERNSQDDELGPIKEQDDLESITKVNMVKNMTKQQRFDLEHRVTFLPPMHRMFKDDVGSNPRESEKDLKRLNMAKKRWLKAYDLAKENFQGSGPRERANPIRLANSVEAASEVKCSEDPRLLRLVSLLSKRPSFCKGNEVETTAAMNSFSSNPL